MLSSIHPLGERARHNRWVVTVSAYTLGSIAGGVATFGGAAVLGAWLVPGIVSEWVVAGIIAVAAIADLTRSTVPGPHRQVNERWIGTYRGWVYGLGFGFQLGVGVVTYVVTWLTHALILTSFLLASPSIGVAAGVAFGAGRAVPVIAAGWIDRPTRLTVFHRAMQTLGSKVPTVAASSGLAVVVVTMVVVSA